MCFFMKKIILPGLLDFSIFMKTTNSSRCAAGVPQVCRRYSTTNLQALRAQELSHIFVGVSYSYNESNFLHVIYVIL